MNPLEAISPVDGRYRKTTEVLAEFFSELALHRYRAFLEVKYLCALANILGLTPPISPDEAQQLKERCLLRVEDGQLIKTIETQGLEKSLLGEIERTRHDVKAVEYYVKLQLAQIRPDLVEWVHFALTSEDVNNFAYALMVRDALVSTIFPRVYEIQYRLQRFVHLYAGDPMLARTHGQPASPTTVGKEFNVFASRLRRHYKEICALPFLVKLNGATGNYDAHVAAFPNIDWVKFTKDFIESHNHLGTMRLEPNLVTTQVESHDALARVFHSMIRINTCLLDMVKDLWRYISDEWIVQKPDGTGSSTMPQKVNPIDFENAEGNLEFANVLLGFFAEKLPQSRLQRDLSGSTVMRNVGVAFAHCLVAYTSILRGLEKISINKLAILEALAAHPEVVSEGIQTILRREGYPKPYETLKALTQGKKITREDLETFINLLDVSERVKVELLHLTPDRYIGLAPQLALLD